MHRTGVAVLGLVVIGMAACTSPPQTAPTPSASQSPTGTPTPSGATPAAAPVVDIVVEPSGVLTMPATLAAGGYVFRVSNNGSEPTTIVEVIEPLDGYTEADLAADLGPHTSMEAGIAGWSSFDVHTRRLGGNGAAPGSRSEFGLTLEPGTFWFAHLPRETVTVTVTGDVTPTGLPQPDAVVTASSDRTWSVPDALPASGTLLVRNPTSAAHGLVLQPAPADVTAQEFLALVRQLTDEAEDNNGPPAVSGGAEFLWVYDLPPGVYAVMDSSASEAGFPQVNGPGASLVTLS